MHSLSALTALATVTTSPQPLLTYNPETFGQIFATGAVALVIDVAFCALVVCSGALIFTQVERLWRISTSTRIMAAIACGLAAFFSMASMCYGLPHSHHGMTVALLIAGAWFYAFTESAIGAVAFATR